MYYSITQTTQKSRFLRKPKNVLTHYTFSNYKEALKFALSEQIKTVTCNVSDEVRTSRRPFKYYLTEALFIKAAKKNPLHYLGTQDYKRVNISKYYYYLISTNQIEKLRKYPI